jgi:hypothetical protein
MIKRDRHMLLLQQSEILEIVLTCCTVMRYNSEVFIYQSTLSHLELLT